MVKLETSVTEPLNCFSGIIISVKTRSDRQLLRLKQINMQLASKIQHLEFSCSEKVGHVGWGECHLLSVPHLGMGFPLPGLCPCCALSLEDPSLHSVFLVLSDSALAFPPS